MVGHTLVRCSTTRCPSASILCCTNLNPFQSKLPQKLCSTRARNVGYTWSVFTIDILCPHNRVSIYMCGGMCVKSILVSCFSLGKRLPQRTGLANACLRILIPGSSLHRSTTRQAWQTHLCYMVNWGTGSTPILLEALITLWMKSQQFVNPGQRQQTLSVRRTKETFSKGMPSTFNFKIDLNFFPRSKFHLCETTKQINPLNSTIYLGLLFFFATWIKLL